MIAGALRLLYNVLVFPWLWLAWRIRSAAAFRRPRALKLRLAQLPIIGGQARSMPFSRRRTIEDLSARLDALARHPRVTGLHVELDATPASLVDGAELRALLDAVRQSGKRVHVHVQQPETRNLAAAAAADRLSTSPGSMVMVGGIGLEIPFAGELLERHGVRVQSVQRREYKGAAEPLARSGPSEPLRESLQALVDALFEALAQTLARPGWQAQRARDLLDRGPLTLQQALDSGLLDAAEHAEEAEQALAGVQSDEAGGESPAPEAPPAPQRRVPDKGARPLPATRRLLPLEAAALLAPRPLALKPEPVIAFVSISGAIIDRPVSGPRQRFAVASELAPRIRALADSARVQAIVLALDTRGGTVTGSDRIWSAARYALGRKPVIAWMRNYAASGGYYIAAAAQSIIASSFTITGSIGVISWKPNVAEACARLGVNPVLISRGGSARMTSVFRPFDEQALEWLEAEIDASYAQFKAVVAEGRRMSDEQVESVAKGRVWTAAQALERGLVDRVGHYRDVLIAARELAQIPQHRRHVVRWIAPPASPLQMLRRFSAQALPAAGVGPPPALAAFVDELYEPWLLAQESPLMYYLPAMTLRC